MTGLRQPSRRARAGRAAALVLAGLLVAARAEALVVAAPVVTLDDQLDPGRPAAVPSASGPLAAPRAEPAPGGNPLAQAGGDHAPSGNPLWVIPLRKLSVTRERPIFSPSRRPRPPAVASAPPVAPAPAPKPSEPDSPQLALVGTVAGATEGIGVFVDQTTKNVIRLKMGEGHKGWILRALARKQATLQKGRETATLAFPQPETKPGGEAKPALASFTAVPSPGRPPPPPVAQPVVDPRAPPRVDALAAALAAGKPPSFGGTAFAPAPAGAAPGALMDPRNPPPADGPPPATGALPSSNGASPNPSQPPANPAPGWVPFNAPTLNAQPASASPSLSAPPIDPPPGIAAPSFDLLDRRGRDARP